MTKLSLLLENVLNTNVEFYPKIDLIELESIIKIFIHLPGLSSKNIKLTFKNNICNISGHYHDPLTNQNNFILNRHTDIQYGPFNRSIIIPCDITNTDGISTKISSGILYIDIDKNLQEQNTFSININD